MIVMLDGGGQALIVSSKRVVEGWGLVEFRSRGNLGIGPEWLLLLSADALGFYWFKMLCDCVVGFFKAPLMR